MAIHRFCRAGIVSVVLLAGCQSPFDLFLAFHGPRPSPDQTVALASAPPVESPSRVIDSDNDEDCRTNTLHDLHSNIRRRLCD